MASIVSGSAGPRFYRFMQFVGVEQLDGTSLAPTLLRVKVGYLL
ncbi:hypothetical protein [Ktedonobacter sp. SOSP1-52]|nr:hypothetical protein [Ktedonobacter sp. SOSP1-52]